ncbi:Histone H2A [Armadillidium vulgare]|nr:Histone H2A [Armadillidium vulgare]
MEYLSTEFLDLTGNEARNNEKIRINPSHLQLAIKNDEELNKVLSFLPNNIQALLLPKTSEKR